ncbi:MAG: hypothetical protein JST70_06250 [Bacteroidetes bacterium]|nr:hypothetical protein [Bacteroidota bacterium]
MGVTRKPYRIGAVFVIFILAALGVITDDVTYFTIAVIVATFLFITSLFGNQIYRLQSDKITFSGIIHRDVFYLDIQEIRRIYSNELGLGVRFGSRLFNSSQGLFHFESIGQVLMHTDNDNNMVFIKTNEVQIIISPKDPDAFIEEMRSRM